MFSSSVKPRCQLGAHPHILGLSLPHCLWAPRRSLQTIWSVWAPHTFFREKQARWEVLGASQRPAYTISGVILSQSGVDLGKKIKKPQEIRGG